MTFVCVNCVPLVIAIAANGMHAPAFLHWLTMVFENSHVKTHVLYEHVQQNADMPESGGRILTAFPL